MLNKRFMYDVITVGSSTIDVFAKVESELIKIKTAHEEEELIAYPAGSKLLIKDLDFLTGGGGTNTAVSLARLGLKVAYLGKTGHGSNSGLILKKLKAEKVNFIGIRSKKHHAGYSIILDSLEGDRTILAYKGANNFLDMKDISFSKLKTKWFYFSSMVGKSFETLKKLAQYAEGNNIKIAFNPSNYLAEKGHEYLKEVLERTTILVLNMEEAELIGGKLKTELLIKKLMSFGPKIVVITDGKKGLYTIHKNNFLYVMANNVKIVETTGAGDAFASTFLAGIIKKKPIEFSLRMGLLNAESVITKEGAKNGLLTYNTLSKLVKSKPPKIKKKKI